MYHHITLSGICQTLQWYTCLPRHNSFRTAHSLLRVYLRYECLHPSLESGREGQNIFLQTYHMVLGWTQIRILFCNLIKGSIAFNFSRFRISITVFTYRRGTKSGTGTIFIPTIRWIILFTLIAKNALVQSSASQSPLHAFLHGKQ